MKFLLSLAILLCASVADARPFSRHDCPQCVQAVEVVEQKVAPPQDSQRWYFSLFADESTANLYSGWVGSNVTLNKLQSQTHFQVYAPSSVMYKQRYASNTKAPCIRLQDSKGFVVYEAVGKNIPKSADALAIQLASAIKSYSGPASGPFRKGSCPCGPDCDCKSCPWRKDKPQPTPQPQPEPTPEPDGPPVIDDEPVSPASNWPSPWAIAASAAVGIGLGGRRSWINAYRKA